jgi:hypothetical protein
MTTTPDREQALGGWQVPDRGDALRVGRAILEAHSQWEKENNRAGGQDKWGEQHVILLGQAALIAAAPDTVSTNEVRDE